MKKEITNDMLNEGTQNLIDQLPDNVGELITVLQEEYQLPLWHLVAGILLEVHSAGGLSAFTIDPAWREGLKQKMLRCQYKACNKLFKPQWLAQKFCCNECGLADMGKGPKVGHKKALVPPTSKEEKKDESKPVDKSRILPVVPVDTSGGASDSTDPIDAEDAVIAEATLGPKSEWGSTHAHNLDDE